MESPVRKIPSHEELKETLNAFGGDKVPQPNLYHEEKEKIDEWKREESPKQVPLPQFKTAEDLIMMVIKGNIVGTIITGQGGLGKTHLTLGLVKAKLSADKWEYKNGFTSPLAFYKFLYENRTKEILILDDIEGLFSTPTGIALLKGALGKVEGKRIVQYNTTSDKAEGIPPTFILKSRLIFLCNQTLNSNDPNKQALLSRVLHYNIKFTHSEILTILNTILEDKKELSSAEKKSVLDILTKETSLATVNLNIRTLENLIQIVQYDEKGAGEIFKATREENHDETVYLTIAEKYDTISAQLHHFTEKTGKGRATFYRIKKRLQEKGYSVAKSHKK